MIRKSVLIGVLAGFPFWQGFLEASLIYGRKGNLTHEPPIFWRPRVNKVEIQNCLGRVLRKGSKDQRCGHV